MSKAAYLGLVSIGILIGCVTVNVNFPEGAVQKATDDYVRELYRSKNKGIDGAESSSLAPRLRRQETSFVFSLVPEAVAADVASEFNVRTPKTMAIFKKLSSRLQEVLKMKKAGIVGENNEGQLVFRSKRKTKKMKSIVEAENRDRKALYEEVLKANNLPDTRLKAIQRSFARSFSAESPSGTKVQNERGKWERKK